jgi:RNA polymerase sigma-70 factor, ECF subfamily
VDPAEAGELLALYDSGLPVVFGYLVRRCGDRATAEDLSSEVFLAAADELCSGRSPRMDLAWLTGIARHKLVDHWRRQSRDERRLQAVGGELGATADPWEAQLDADLAHQVLASLPTPYRAALTLRYLDDLTVPDVAATLGRSLHATESLLTRARAAFRVAYLAKEGSP